MEADSTSSSDKLPDSSDQAGEESLRERSIWERERDFLPVTVLSLSLDSIEVVRTPWRLGHALWGKKSLNSAPARTASTLEGNSRETRRGLLPGFQPSLQGLAGEGERRTREAGPGAVWREARSHPADLHVAGPVSFTKETIGCTSKGISALNQNQQAEQVRNIGWRGRMTLAGVENTLQGHAQRS